MAKNINTRMSTMTEKNRERRCGCEEDKQRRRRQHYRRCKESGKIGTVREQTARRAAPPSLLLISRTKHKSGVRIGNKIKRMMDIQTETNISTDRRTERQADKQTDRKRRTDSESRAGMQKKRWVQGLTGQIREQEQNQEKAAGGDMKWH
ncbi:hypothetical protein Q5P01_017017 [Channa striata]|uniref:Uncharacterized protein n=1 Tax=Channa striata TaxID=64152 RepID=A0AA88M8S5_CHASR|nr:hypothetical protein Q5P01_017017 [Channa striata]